MRPLRSAVLPGVGLCLACAAVAAGAGDHFLQFRVEKSRCCIRDYGYQTGGKPTSAVVLSNSEIPLPGGRRKFVIEPPVAGPVTFSELTALAVDEQQLVVSGVLLHAGDVQQIRGGHVEVRVEALTATVPGSARGVVIGTASESLWLPTGPPKPLTLRAPCEAVSGNSLEKIEKVRVYLTYRP
jgi:hypothetical protein